MAKRSLQQILKPTALTSVTLLALSARAGLQERTNDHQQALSDPRDRDDDRHDREDNDRGRHHGLLRLPTGQYVSPTAIEDAVQEYLNPGLPGYPNFIAGEAVRSQLSPDGTTLAVLTAGQNSLYKPDGSSTR